MKRIATLVAASVMAASSNAAIITTNVTGVLGDWYTKIFSNPIVYQTFLVGNPDIIVQGSISYDDVTNDLTALSLYQIGSLSAAVNNNTPSAPGTMTISALSWSLAGSNINQVTGYASCNDDNLSVACDAVAAAINTQGNSSPFEFDGIAKGFKVGGIKQIQKYGYVDTIDGSPDIYIETFADEAYQPDSSFNATHNTLFQLTAVPVPAAAWLMGSALVGLAGIARRRR